MGRIRLAALIAVDTSALVAIVPREPERDAFETAILSCDQALISTVSVVETRMPLLFKGNDFVHTDILSAAPPV